MNKQSEALVLADALEHDKWHVPAVVMQESADELRRLHAVNAELLEALKRLLKELGPINEELDVMFDEYAEALSGASAAIKNAEAA